MDEIAKAVLELTPIVALALDSDTRSWYKEHGLGCFKLLILHDLPGLRYNPPLGTINFKKTFPSRS